MNNMYVSKELSLILKEKGFNEKCVNFYINNDDKLFTHNKPINFNSSYGLVMQTFYPQTNILTDNKIEYFSAPTEHQTLNWIFSASKWDDSSVIVWLHFWYNTLLEHKFNLMYEFIGRLEEWFENNDLRIHLILCYDNMLGYMRGWDIEINELCIGNQDCFETKQQAKHEAILKCFELLKQE